MNYLRSKFLLNKVPWTAEADLLLSDLCNQVGYGLYAMDLPVRNYLLQGMRSEFGVARMGEVARLLLSYVHHLAQTDRTSQPEELQSQRWAAMAYLDDTRAQVVEEVVQSLNQCVLTHPQNSDSVKGINWNELARLLRLIDELAPQLGEYPELMEYAKLASTIMSDVSGDETLMLMETNALSKEFRAGDKALPMLDLFVSKNRYHKISSAAIVHHETWMLIEDAFLNRRPISGTVIGAVKGGLRVDVGGIVAFLPASEIDIYFVANLETFLGNEIEAFVIQASREQGSFVLSRKALIESQDLANLDEAFANLEEGIIVEGEIQQLTDFGAFVNLGKTEGLIHVSEMSWGFTDHPNRLFSVGERVVVKVIKVDRENAQIDLSYRELLPNPWLSIDERYSVGMSLRGKVLRETNRWIYLEVEPQIVGLLSRKEVEQFVEHKDFDFPRIGEELNVLIIEIDANRQKLILSVQKSLEEIEANLAAIAKSEPKWEELDRAFNAGSIIKCRVGKRIRGGFLVDVGGISAFLPSSQIDIRPVKDLDAFQGQVVEVKIIRFDRKDSDVVLSRKAVIEIENAGRKDHTLRHIEEGVIVEGRIKNLTDYGAFVDLGGVDGLLHVTDMSWGRLQNPNELFKVGDNIQVKVLTFDRERERVTLGYKQLQPDPWSSVEERFPIGTRVNGRIASVADYGAFVELESGVEGLVHVSEMSWSKRVKHPSKIVNPGDNVEVEVLRVDPKARRISLGMKQTQDNPWRTLNDRYQVGSRVHGRVRNLTDFGAFIEIEDGVDGLVHVSDMPSSRRTRHPSEVFKKGQEVHAIITSIDVENRRLSLSIKDLGPNAWERFVLEHKPGDVVKGKIARFANFGAFVELDDNLEGLCHISELSDERVAKPEDVVQVGQEMDFKILRIDSESKKIGLSARAIGKDEPIPDTKTYSSNMDSGMASLGELAESGKGSDSDQEEE